MSNHLQGQSSPYLLQHMENPVDWYPWGREAFDRAEKEDKPVFLSIGYSSCHWCHVMARESFEDERVAALLNEYFICVKVDKEERPDIDSVYMAVCQAFTGSGGWPTSIFLTPKQQPFFAGTYFPPRGAYGLPGLEELLDNIRLRWQEDREALLQPGREVMAALKDPAPLPPAGNSDPVAAALTQLRAGFDAEYGGFGRAPKFPSPHVLLFLLTCSQRRGDKRALEMAEKTLASMYAGGIFDHFGYGFCRYATDRRWLIPHFEKMLYDNALLMLAYTRAFDITQNPFYLQVACQTAEYILRDMLSPQGGFFSSQDADSEGEEGKYYLFTPDEIIKVLGKRDGDAVNDYYGITAEGNFNGLSLPNLLHHQDISAAHPEALVQLLLTLEQYRRHRCPLHTDDKILTAWNALTIAGLTALAKSSGDGSYLLAAKMARRFIEQELCRDDTLWVSWRQGQRGGPGFLDDYAAYIMALLGLYDATGEGEYKRRALSLAHKTIADFFDEENGGFYLYSREQEQLILRPKDTFDNALPGGNSLMAHDLSRLYELTDDPQLGAALDKQMDFMRRSAREYPTGHAAFLTVLA